MTRSRRVAGRARSPAGISPRDEEGPFSNRDLAHSGHAFGDLGLANEQSLKTQSLAHIRERPRERKTDRSAQLLDLLPSAFFGRGEDSVADVLGLERVTEGRRAGLSF